jgi:predicted ATP-grasp superfamily ATP-dependent carboligase
VHPPHDAIEAIVILAASARWIAASAWRAGLEVFAADLFGDRDLHEVCRRHCAVTGYPDGLIAAAAGFPPAPWIYGGAVENHHELIAAIARDRPLAGCPPPAVRAVRDPAWLARACRESGLAHPETRFAPDGLPLDGSYLVKPRAGAGGRGIALWTPPAATRDRAAGHWLWQRRVEGSPRSVSLLLGRDPPRIIGTSEQLIGLSATGGPAFGWCGGVESEGVCPNRFLSLAGTLAAVGCRGLVGVDFVEDETGHCHVLEVNPRPTASMELFERSGGASLVADHLEACGYRLREPAPRSARTPAEATGDSEPRLGTSYWAKGILFAHEPLRLAVGGQQAWESCADRWRPEDDGWPAVADLPNDGGCIRAGGPILSVFARGVDPATARSRLEDRLQILAERLGAGRFAAPATRVTRTRFSRRGG